MRLAKSFGDLEVAFIREFAHGELYRLASMTAQERQERIRVAITSAGLQNLPFGDHGMTYAQSYRQAFKSSCELRRWPRESEPSLKRGTQNERESAP